MLVCNKHIIINGLTQFIFALLIFSWFPLDNLLAKIPEQHLIQEYQRQLKKKGIRIHEAELADWLKNRKYKDIEYNFNDILDHFIERFPVGDNLSNRSLFIPPGIGSNTILGSKEDFQVNEENFVNSYDKYWPDITSLPNGSYILTWYDYRNGDSDIFLQIYDSLGQAMGSNILVNDDGTGADQSLPRISSTSDGSFVIVWEDNRSREDDWMFDIYLQRYDNLGQPLGINIKTNESTWGSCAWSPDVSCSSDGSIVAVWEDDRRSQLDIYYQRYDGDGYPVGDNVKVNEEFTYTNCSDPEVSVCKDGPFVIVWGDEPSGNRDIYMQYYGAEGQGIENNIMVNDDTTTLNQNNPEVCFSSDTSYVIVWKESSGGNSDVYVQQYINTGQPIGDNVKVNESEVDRSSVYPSVSSSLDGSFIVVWHDSDYGYIQLYDSLGQKKEYNRIVNNDNIDTWRGPHSVSCASDGSFIVVWPDVRNGNDDIYMQHYNNMGQAQGNNMVVNTDAAGENQGNPLVSSFPDGSFVIVWEDYGADDAIYLQRYDNTGSEQGSYVKLNDEWDPAICSLSDGSFLVVYSEGADGDIYFNRYNKLNQPMGSEIKINNATGRAWVPSVSSSDGGNFLVVWENVIAGSTESNSDVYLQYYDSLGQTIGANVKVNDDNTQKDQYGAKAACTTDGSFMVVWNDNRNDYREIYYQCYDNLAQPQGNNIKTNIINPRYNSIGVTSIGYFMMVWSEYNGGTINIYLQRYDNSGLKIGSVIKVNDMNIGLPSGIAEIASVSNGSFVVVWEDERNGRFTDIYAQKYTADGIPLGSNFRVNNDQTLKNQFNPDVSINGNNEIIFVWEDNRIPEHGYDIFAKIMDFDSTNMPPVFPELTIPEDGTVINDTSFTLFWNIPLDSDGDSLHFLVEIDDDGTFGLGTLTFDSRNDTAGFSPTPPVQQGQGSASYTMQTKISEGDWWWRVSAFDGKVSGVPSQVRRFSVDLRPDQPQNLTAKPDNQRISLSWSPNNESDLSHYVIYASQQPGFTPISTDSVGGVNHPDTTYTHINLTNGITYYYRISAVDSAGSKSEFSSEVSATPMDMDLKPDIILSDLQHSFGKIDIHTTEGWQFSITNAGSDTLVVYDINLFAKEFSVMDTSGIIIPDADMQVNVTFLPLEAKQYLDTLKILSNDPDESELRVTLIGQGILPTQESISVLPNPFTPNNDGYNDYVAFKYPEMYNKKPVVRIFNLRGRKVNELNHFSGNEYRWYGKDEDGKTLEPGVYLYILEVDNKTISSGTITMVR